MIYSFGQTIRIKKEGFYFNSIGIIIGYDEVDNTYQILLPFSRIVFLYGSEVVKTRKKKIK